MKVLVVDDNKDALYPLVNLLQIFGHEAYAAASGAESLALGLAVEPDAVVLDLGMPIMDGFEVAKRLKAEPWGLKVFLIALTGWGSSEDIRKTKEAGFQAHLVKPLELPELLRLLKDQNCVA